MTFPRAGTRPNTTVRDTRRLLPGDSTSRPCSPRGDPAHRGSHHGRAGCRRRLSADAARTAAVGGSVNLPDDGLAK